MFLFKFATGKCILHTGDFRACAEMESEPVFWNNDIDTIYLDTTYLPHQYSFCTQDESIDRAKCIVKEFRQKHTRRSLYICGSYVIGKEKFWCALAEEFNWKVWVEASRYKALQIMKLPEMVNISFVNDAEDADLHVIPLVKLSYPVLVEYLKSFSNTYDVLLALRPSGWEKNKPVRLSGYVSVVGVEYSEHSSYNELERFIKYLKPRQVISTVPVGPNSQKTGDVPTSWYQYDKLTAHREKCQPSITSYMPASVKKLTYANATKTAKT